MVRLPSASLALAILAAFPAPLFATTDSWLNPVAGAWEDSTQWSAGLPTPSSDVVLDAIGSPYTVRASVPVANVMNSITISSANATLSVGTTFNLNGGNISVIDGTLLLAGATFQNARIQTSGNGVASIYNDNVWYSTLDNVTLAANLTLPTQNRLSILHNLTLDNAAIHLQSSTSGGFGSTFTFDSGIPQSITGTGTIYFDVGGYTTAGNNLLTIDSNITIATGTGGGTLTFAQNKGTISAQTSSLTISGSNWTNLGIFQVGGNGSLTFTGNYSTAALGTFVRSGGSVQFGGTLDNTNSTLNLDPIGPIDLFGTIKGGIISSSTPATLLGQNGATLNGVTVNAPLTIAGPVTIKNGLTLNSSAINISAETTLTFADTTGLAGNATINVNAFPNSTGFLTRFSNVTIGSGITLQTGSANANSSGGIALIGFNNYGAIRAQTPDMPVYLGTDGTPGSGAQWSNHGSILVSAGSLYLGGSFTTADALSIVHTGGTIYFQGSLNNTNSTLAFNSTTGPWLFTSGFTITGGNVTATPGFEPVILADTGGALNNVSFASNITLQQRSGLSVLGAITLNNATISMQGYTDPSSLNYTLLQANGVAQLTGTGIVRFDGPGTQNAISGNLTIGPNVTIQTGSSSGYFRAVNGTTIQNFGTLSAQTPNAFIAISANFINNGTISVTNGSFLGIFGNLTNNGSIVLNQGSVLVNNLTTPILGNFDRSNGNVVLINTLPATPTIDLGNTTYGRLDLGTNAVISSATITSSNGTPQIINTPAMFGSIANPPKLTSVTLQTDLNITPAATLFLAGGITLSNATIHLAGTAANLATLNFNNGSSSGTGAIAFDGDSNANVMSNLFTLSANLTVRSGATGGTINTTNANGTISAQTANATITVAPTQTFSTSSTSLLQAINGGTLVISANASIGGGLNVDASSSVTITGNFAESSQFGVASLTGTGPINAKSINGNFKILTNTVHITGTGLNTVSNLTIGGSTDAWTGKLDIGNADLRSSVFNGKPTLATLQNQLRNGAIFSSNLTASIAVALFSGPDYAAATGTNIFDGQSVTSSDNLLKIALLGDANLDNTVDLSDLSTILNNFGQPSLSWTHGNFDYAPTIDLTDLSDVLNNFGQSLTTPTLADPVTTPEPTSLTLLAFAAPLLLKRRRENP